MFKNCLFQTNVESYIHWLCLFYSNDYISRWSIEYTDILLFDFRASKRNK